MNKLILIALVATTSANQRCATNADLIYGGSQTYKLKYMETLPFENKADLITAKPFGFDNDDKTSCGPDCFYMETEYDTNFKIIGAPDEAGFRIYSEDENYVMSWNQRAAGRGYYMFDVSKTEFIIGKYRYYTLMNYDENDSKLHSGYDNNRKFIPLGISLQIGTEIFRQEAEGVVDAKFCFVDTDSIDEVETANECATKDELINSNFENYKLKYKIEDEYEKNDDLTTGASIGFKPKDKFTCPQTCGGGHMIRAGRDFDTTFTIKGVPAKDGFRIFSEDKRKVFSWNQVGPFQGVARTANATGAVGSVAGGAAGAVFGKMALGSAGIAVAGSAGAGLASVVGGAVGATAGLVHSAVVHVHEGVVGWGFYMYDVDASKKYIGNGDYQHYSLMSYNDDHELQYTDAEGKRAAVGLRHDRNTAIYRKGEKSKFCFVKVENANQLLPY